ncbi:MAG: hypothetical protein WAN51_12585 [Alphaproteobacteria bacterium]
MDRENGLRKLTDAKLNGDNFSQPTHRTGEQTYMTTSLATSTLSKPVPGDQIPLGTLGYFRALNRSAAYELVVVEFQTSGITQAELARRLGKGTDVVCRTLGAPGNWGLDTVSDYLFAIFGAVPVYSRSYPLEAPARNDTQPEWLGPTSAVMPAGATGGSMNIIGTMPPAISSPQNITRVMVEGA